MSRRNPLPRGVGAAAASGAPVAGGRRSSRASGSVSIAAIAWSRRAAIPADVDVGHRLQPIHVRGERAAQRREVRPVETRELGVGELQRGDRRLHVGGERQLLARRVRAPARLR